MLVLGFVAENVLMQDLALALLSLDMLITLATRAGKKVELNLAA